MFCTLWEIRCACVISLRNFSALLRSSTSPSSCVEPLLHFSWRWRRSWRRSSRLLEGLCSVAENASTIHCRLSRDYFLTSGNSCWCCRASQCAGSAAGGQPVLWEWSWTLGLFPFPSLLFLRSDAWKMPSAGTTVTPATAAGSRASTSVPRCSISNFRSPSWQWL